MHDMTTEEFNNTRFGINTVIDYNGLLYTVIGVDFALKKIHIQSKYLNMWVYYDKCRII